MVPGRIFHGSCSAACRANSAWAPAPAKRQAARGSRAAREGRRPCGLGPLGAGTQENSLQLSPPGAQLCVPGFTPDHLSGSLNWPDDYSDIEIFHWGGERGVRKETRGEEKDLPGRTKLESTPVTDADSALAPRVCVCARVCTYGVRRRWAGTCSDLQNPSLGAVPQVFSRPGSPLAPGAPHVLAALRGPSPAPPGHRRLQRSAVRSGIPASRPRHDLPVALQSGRSALPFAPARHPTRP